MTRMRRALAVIGFMAVIGIIGSALQGQQGKKAGPVTTPQATTPAKQVSQLAEAAIDSRFSLPGVLTYQPLKGDNYFALQLQPKLEKPVDRPRDILIMMSTTATQGGPGFSATHQIAEGIIKSTGREFDGISLWTVNEPKLTKNLTKEFHDPKDFAGGKHLMTALEKYRKGDYPAGTADLKDALERAIASFDTTKDRQRIILFLGDGFSTFNPMTENDRHELAQKMVAARIAFFPVPLGIRLNANTLHGLANSTGGIVLRTTIEEEKLTEALKRYEEAFANPVLYGAKLTLPAGVTGVVPSVLPPLRSDSPTLVAGRINADLKKLDYSLRGTIEGRKGAVTINASEAVLAHNLDNYFLVTMIDQWQKADNFPAVLRADRALVNTYEATRLQYQEYLDLGQLALEDGKYDAASRFFHQASSLSPTDGQAAAGIKIVDRLKDGSLTRASLAKAAEKRAKQGDALKTVDGKPRWTKVDFAMLAQAEAKAAAAGEKVGDPKIAPENLLKEHRDRLAIEEQKIANSVEDAVRFSQRNLKNDPDGTLDQLRNLLNRVKDHPDLSAVVREGLSTRLQTALQVSAAQVKDIKLTKAAQNNAAAVASAAITKELEYKTFEDRVDAQFRTYKNLMYVARAEERTKMEIMQAMVQIQDEARLKGYAVPVATKATYDVALAAYPLQLYNTLIRKREENWLALQVGIEKSHIPYPDEPYIHFPPLVTWKALMKARKNKYEVTSLPDDEKGREEAAEIYNLLQQPIETKGLSEKVKLKAALEYFSDKFGGKLPILVDREAFAADLGADAPDPYEEEVSLPAVPSKMVMNTALRLILSQVGKGEATYVIRRSFIEITTAKRYLEDKVIRIYPVGDLAMPINGGSMMGGMGMMGMMGMGGMGMMGMGGMGMMGMGGMGMGGMNMMGMGGMNMMGMGGMNMMGMGGMGMGGMNMMGMGGMNMGMGGMGGFNMGGMNMMGMGGGMNMMGMGGMNMMGMGGGMNMMGMGGMNMMGMGGMNMMGMGGMGMGMMGMGGGGMTGFSGGSFQGSFNGSLGAMGATQAVGLIDIITRIVDPGNWNKPPTLNPFLNMGMGFPGPGMVGMLGMLGMAGMPGMVGMGPPVDPTVTPPDPQQSNSIDFFPPALAIIVRAPSRMHTSITGGIVGGRSKRLEAAAWLKIEKDGGLAKLNNKDPKIKVGAGADMAKIKERPDPMKVWNEAFAKGGVTPGHVVATADFLFESGEFKHAAEFLKSNLRNGVVVRPWVFEALAVALEASGAHPEEVRRARLSGIALDPNDAQGFMSAARAMADRGQYDRALAFCRQAALLEPNDYHPYEAALAYAESAKDPVAMEWAVGKLVSQDWPVDNIVIQAAAKKRLGSLVGTLKTDNRAADANKLEAALQRLNQRDLIVQLVWENAGGPAELEMKIKEPSGSICNLAQKQTPGGGIMIGYNLTDKEPSSQYIVSQAFSGDYVIDVTRVYGQPLNNRARLIITQNAGTDKQTRRIEIVRLDQNAPIKINLKDGRRTELASVSPAAQERKEQVSEEAKRSAFNDLRAVANPNFTGVSGPRGGAGAPGIPSVAAMAARDSKNKATTTVMQNAVTSAGGVQMTAQMRMSPDQRNLDVVIRPFFDMVNTRENRPAINLSVIPGGGN